MSADRYLENQITSQKTSKFSLQAVKHTQDCFSSWYTDKLHGNNNSPYEHELKKLLLGNMRGNDSQGSMNYRYRMMRAHNPLSFAYRSAFPETISSTKHPDIDARGWNQDLWHCVYEHGIPPLNCKETEKRYRKWSMENDFPENDGEFVRLHHYFSLAIARNRRTVPH